MKKETIKPAMETSKSKKKFLDNPMRKIKIEKIVLSCGAVGPDLERSRKLLELLSGKKAQIIKAGPKQRIPAFDVKPGLELGVRVTLRGREAVELIKRLLGAIDNKLTEKQISENSFSFGIREYIEIPGIEYQRDIGIRGLNVTVAFYRFGTRVKRKKIKSARIPKKQIIQPEEIIRYMEENFKTKVKPKKK
jgi:large subunit ribosomal protein L5